MRTWISIIALVAVGSTMSILAAARSVVVPVGNFAYGSSEFFVARLFWWVWPVASMAWVVTVPGVCRVRRLNVEGYARLGYLIGLWLVARLAVFWPMAYAMLDDVQRLPTLDKLSLEWRLLLLTPSDSISVGGAAAVWALGGISVALTWATTRLVAGHRGRAFAKATVIMIATNAVLVQFAAAFRHPFVIFVVWSIGRIAVVAVWQMFGGLREPLVDVTSHADR